jgi:hypothetical protein
MGDGEHSGTMILRIAEKENKGACGNFPKKNGETLGKD